jgi:type IV secretory pathway VirB10-like protein
MLSNRAAFALLAVACITAAGGGAYLATRQSATSPAPLDASASAEAPIGPATPVQETEAVIGEAARPEPVPLAAASSAAPARKRNEVRETPSRTAPRSTRQAESTNARNSQLPTLERSWPSGHASAPPSSPAQAPVAEPPAEVERTAPEPPRAPEPPAPVFEELVVSADSVIGVQVESALSSETARVEDRVEAQVVRDVRAGGAVAIPAGSRALGSVTLVERGGKFKERARLGIRFHTLVLADGTRLPITTETIYRHGEAPGQTSAAKIGGGAVIGAILGGIAGGAKGAAIGAATGGGAGTTAVAVGDRKPATFSSGTEVTARILSPVTVTIEK